MKILVAALIKNEAERFLPSALKAWGSFADKILILDDNSEDESVFIAQAAGAEVVSRNVTIDAWGAESSAREHLWLEAVKRTEIGDYIFILDADMTPVKNPVKLLEGEPSAIAFPLFDLWAEYSDGMLMYREDGLWQYGLSHPRIWMARREEEPLDGWKFNTRGVHCGHLPVNLDYDNIIFAPQDYGLLHYAYLDSELRNGKFKQYYDVKEQLDERERAHAQSILDQNPKMKVLEFEPELRLRKVK